MRHYWSFVVLLFFALASTSLVAQKGGGGRGGAATTGSNSTPAPYSGPYSSTPVSILPGAHADDEKKVEFRSETVLVQVPTVVTDKAGNHIHSLKKEDFKVEENGKEQKITVFEEITASNARLLQASNPPGTFSNLAQNGDPPRNVAVIALDTVNTPFLDQTYGRQQLVKYLADNLDSVPVMAMVVIGSKGVRTITGLTSDPASLLNALKKVRGELPSLQGVDIDAQALSAAGGGNTGMAPLLSPGGDPTAQIEQFVSQGDAVLRRLPAISCHRKHHAGVPGHRLVAFRYSGKEVAHLGHRQLSFLHGFSLDRARRIPVDFVRAGQGGVE
jgi:hypothetical protein